MNEELLNKVRVSPVAQRWCAGCPGQPATHEVWMILPRPGEPRPSTSTHSIGLYCERCAEEVAGHIRFGCEPGNGARVLTGPSIRCQEQEATMANENEAETVQQLKLELNEVKRRLGLSQDACALEYSRRSKAEAAQKKLQFELDLAMREVTLLKENRDSVNAENNALRTRVVNAEGCENKLRAERDEATRMAGVHATRQQEALEWVGKLTHELSGLREKLAEVNDTDLWKRVFNAEAAQNKLQRQLDATLELVHIHEAAESRETVLQREIEELREALAAACDSRVAAQRSVEELRGQLDTEKEKTQHFYTKLAESDAKVDSRLEELCGQLGAEKEESKRLYGKLAESAENLDAMRARLAQTEFSRVKFRDQLGMARAASDRLRTQLAEADAKNEGPRTSLGHETPMPTDAEIRAYAESHRLHRSMTPETIYLAGVYPAALTLPERQEWTSYCHGSEVFRDLTAAEAKLNQAVRATMGDTDGHVNKFIAAKQRMVECAQAWLRSKGLEG